MNDRESELAIAGARPSTFAKVKVGAKKDGTLTAWESKSWGTGGMTGGGAPPIPYVWRIPHKMSHTSVETNIGSARAWRAPNHPQACFVTMCALEDLAAQLQMDPMDLFLKNIELASPRAALYKEQLLKAAELSDWKKKWHPRGDKTAGPVKRGMGLSLHTWGGLGHESECRVTINSDGSVSAELCSQDLGTGTRTVIGIVAAETLGIPLSGVQVRIGDTRYPSSGSSGGSTTVGGVSASTRRAAVDARDALFKQAAPALNADPANLESVGGKIQVKGDPAKSIGWKQACARIGVNPISVIGKRLEGKDELISQGVGGVQIAEVQVDTETGIVKVDKMVAVQDVGLIVNMKTAESQVRGALIMGISYSLFEEKIMDRNTGRMLNPNMEFYRTCRVGRHRQPRGAHDDREGSGRSRRHRAWGAACRFPGGRHLQRGGECDRNVVSATCRSHLVASWQLWSRKEGSANARIRICKPHNQGTGRGPARVAVGRTGSARRGHGSAGPHEGLRGRAEAGREHQGGGRITGVEVLGRRGIAAGRARHASRNSSTAMPSRNSTRPSLQAAEGVSSAQVRALGTVGGDLCQRPRCWYFPGRHGSSGTGRVRQVAGRRRRESLSRDSGQLRPGLFCQPVQPGAGA